MIYPFILTFLAGIATLLGSIPIFVKFKDDNKIIAGSCSFASGVMITLSIMDLIPEGIRYLNTSFNGFIIVLLCFVFVMCGVFLSIITDKYFDKNNGSDLFKVGLLSMFVIILHNIPEGIITFIVSNKNVYLGISLCIAIAMHNIPEGISIAIPIYYATRSRFKAFSYTLISALSEFLGAIITYLFLGRFVSDTILGIILSVTSGVMISISLYKLLPTGKKYNKYLTYIFFIVGIIFMIINLQLNSLIS